ncbi:MAG: RNA-binding domain-containing protein [Lentisphaeria bacterium]|jgi:ATP-dependent DNA helicase RecG
MRVPEIAWLLEAKEGENIEFKRAENSFEFDDLAKYACALANRGGGYVVFGITDKRPRQVVGSKAFEQPERTRNGLMERLRLRVDFHLLNHEGKRILVFDIPPRPVGVPIQDKGITWWREGDSLVEMPMEEMRAIFAEVGHDFSADICKGADLTDLDGDAIEAFRRKWLEKSRSSGIAAKSQEQLLLDCEAITDKGVTYAALTLFGRREALGRLLGQAEVIFEYRANEASGPAQQRDEFRQGLFAFHDRLWELINLRNSKQHYQDGLFVFDVLTFDERVVREAVLNAVCHRDYQLGGPVFVRQYPQRLVVDSPGGFPPDITLENILDRQSPRNRRIADILARCGLVERSGQGMNLMFELSVKQAKALPDFRGTDRMHVTLTLDGLVQDPKLLTMMERIGLETLQSFGTADFLVVNHVRRDQPVPDNLRDRIPFLIDRGVIERVAHGRFILGRRFYATIGKKGVYTRKRGLDRETNKELLLKHIRDNANTGSRLEELLQVLPSLSRCQVQALVRQLKHENRIRLEGTTRAGKWYPMTVMADCVVSTKDTKL